MKMAVCLMEVKSEALRRITRMAGIMLAGAGLLGCAGPRQLTIEQCGLFTNDVLARLDTRRISDDMVAGLCPPAPDPNALPQDTAVVVPDLVDVQTLQANRLGKSMGELFRASINKICKVPIRQVELSRQFKLNPDGLTALSRNHAEVRDSSFPANVAIVGTYHLQSDKLTLVGRRIDLETSTILAVSTVEATWRCDLPRYGAPVFSSRID